MSESLLEKQHDIGRSNFVEFTPNINPTNIVEWDSPAKNYKLTEDIMTYSGGIVTQVISKKYIQDGTVVETITSTPSYTGALLDNITQVKT